MARGDERAGDAGGLSHLEVVGGVPHKENPGGGDRDLPDEAESQLQFPGRERIVQPREAVEAGLRRLDARRPSYAVL